MATEAPTTTATRRRSPLSAVAEVAALVAVQLLLIRNFRQALDFDICDEVGYYYAGRSLLTDDPGLTWAWSPLYSLCYTLVAPVPLGSVSPLDIMYVAVCIGSTLAIWWMMRGFFPPALAFCLAAWWAGAPVLTAADHLYWDNPQHATMVNPFSMALLAVSVGFVARRRLLVAALGLALLFGTRPETGAVALAFGLLLLVFGRLRGEGSWLRSAAVLSCLGAVLLVFALFHPGMRERAWFNFCQNYSFVSVIRGAAPPDNAFETATEFYEERLRAAFPEAQSIPEAALENPTQFAAHCLYNLTSIPAQLRLVCFESFRHLGWLRTLFLSLAGALALLGLLVHRCRIGQILARCPLRVWLVLASTLAILPVLVTVQSRARFLLPFVPLVLTVCGCLMLAGWRGLVRGSAADRLRLVPPVVLPIVLVLTPPVFSPRQPVHRTSVALLRRVVPDEPLGLLTTRGGSYRCLLGYDKLWGMALEELEPELRTADFARVVRETRPHLVLANPLVWPFAARHRGMIETLFSPRWESRTLRPGYQLFVRAGLDLELDIPPLEDTYPVVLKAASTTLSLSRGALLAFRIDAGQEHSRRPYLLLGTMSGSAPGLEVGQESLLLPLNPDPYLAFTFAHPNTLIEGSLGRLDAWGKATARLRLPPGLPAALAHTQLHHACLVLQPEPPIVLAASNATMHFLVE